MPFQNQIHIDQLLSEVSVKYQNNEYIAQELFPAVMVKKSSDLFRVYDRNFRIPETIRGHKAVAREHNFEVSYASYVLERHALKDYVIDSDAENYDISSLEVDTTEELTDKILKRLEKSACSLITSTSWSLSLSLTSTLAWNATTTVDPVSHFDTGTVTVVANSGMKPNYAGMALQSWFALKNNAQILDRVKYTSSEVGEAMVASLIGAQKLLVSSQSEDTANEGASGGAAISSMWGHGVLWAHRPAAVGPKQASAGYTFKKNTPMVSKYRVDERKGNAIEVEMEYSVRVVASLAGFLINDVT